MRKFFGIILAIVSVAAVCAFFVLLNLKTALLDQDKIKSIISESKVYDLSASYIRDNIIKDTGLILDEGSNFEEINNIVSADTVKLSIDSAVDRFFVAFENPTPANLIFPVSFYGHGAANNYTFSKNVNLTENKEFMLLGRMNLVLIGLGIVFLLFGYLSIVLITGNIAEQTKNLGLLFLVVGISLTSIFILLSVIGPGYYDLLLEKTQFVREPKLLNASKKIISAVLSSQIWIYVLEIATFIILGITFFIFGRSNSKQQLERLEDLLSLGVKGK
ncbi:MAG: hypothetical protein WC107_03525 [Patescibacteria group bacterium]